MNLIKKYFASLTGLFSFIVYLTTIAPSVIQIDSGELAAVQATLGIAHPTGYPLFTLTGYIFSLIPFGFSKIFQLNILSAVWCSLGVIIFVHTSKLVLDNITSFGISPVPTLPAGRQVLSGKVQARNKESKKSKRIKGKEIVEKNASEISEEKKYIASAAGGLILAFSQTFWFQSTSVEVYSLHIFIINLIILFLLKSFLLQNKETKFTIKDLPAGQAGPWLLFSLFLALGFSNHMTTLLILPGTAYLYFIKYRFNKGSFTKIGIMLLIFFPVLILIYSYLPVRASQNPQINWGNPVDLERILRHISGKQYQVWLFSSTESAKKQLIYFINSLPKEFTVTLFISIIGLFTSFSMARKFFLFVLITFLSTILYSINYDINDIDSYFLLAYISIAFFTVFGVVKLFTLLRMKKYSSSIVISIVSLFILVEVYSSYDKTNQSFTYTFEDYTKALISSTPKNSIIFSYQWDYFISSSYYFQFVEGFRRDAVIIDKELLRRSWYFNQIKNMHPGVLSGVENVPTLSGFLKALQPFERDENFDPNLLENLYKRLMTNLVSANIDTRDFFVAPELFENEMQNGQFQLPHGYTLVPDLFLFKVANGNSYIPASDPNFKIRFPENRNHYINFIENLVGSMLSRRALYEMQFNKIDRAKIYIQKIKSDLPNYILPRALAQIDIETLRH